MRKKSRSDSPNNFFKKSVLLNFLLVLLVPAALFAQSGISLKSLELPSPFRLRSDFYTVDPVVKEAKEPGFLKFRVRAPHADYEVEGLVSLAKLLREIEVIERIRRHEAGSGFVEGAVDSVKATGQGFVNLVVHPIQSGKGIGGATAKLGRSFSGLFREKEEGEKTSFGETVLGGSKRELAKEFGVDVYSDNPYLQEILNRMAKARLSGKGAVMIGKLLIPVVGVVAVAVTASGINSLADRFVDDKSRPELFYYNQRALEEMGFREDEVKQLLNLPFYSPREATYIRFYLEKLQLVLGSREILRAAVRSRSVLQARKVLYEAQLACDFMDEKMKYRKIHIFEEGLAVETLERVLFITPYDYLDKSSLGDRVVAVAVQLKEQWSKRGAEIWNGGKVTPAFSSFASLKGIKIRSWILFKS